MTKKKSEFGDYRNVPGGPEGLIKLGKELNLACKYPGCLCESKCLRRDEPFCDGCGAPEDWCQCDGDDDDDHMG